MTSDMAVGTVIHGPDKDYQSGLVHTDLYQVGTPVEIRSEAVSRV